MFAAVRESGDGTFETCRLHRAMSAFRGNPEDICSHWVLLSLTRNGHRPESHLALVRTASSARWRVKDRGKW